MNTCQGIKIPDELNKYKDFSLKISQNNEKVYSHIQYLKYLVQSMYQLYRKLTKSLIKLTQQYQKKMSKLNDSTALSILNFIKGISKLFHNIKQQINNNTVNISKKNQKVSKTRKQIIHQKLIKINQLFIIYLEKVQKYNRKQSQYQSKCQYFINIDLDPIKFYSTKQNKLIFDQLQKKHRGIQQQLQETYSLKIQLKSGLCEIRLSLKQFFEMLSNNAQDDKKLLMSVRKKLKQTKIFNETIIQQVNSQAQQSVRHVQQKISTNMNKYNNSSNIINDSNQKYSINNNNPIVYDQNQLTFSALNNGITIAGDIKDITNNIQLEEYCIQTFCQFVSYFEKQIIQIGQLIDKIRNTQEFQKFIDKKFQINQMLTSDMVYNTQAIKNQIADVRQIIQSIKGFLNKKKVINQLKKYRAMKFDKFISQTEILVELQKKSQTPQQDLRLKYKQQKQKFAKGHLQLMRRFRQMVQDMFRDVNQGFRFQRNPDQQFKKIKNQFIKKKYYFILMLTFFINKQEPPKLQLNPYLKSYQKYISQQQLQKIGLAHIMTEQNQRRKKGWTCCGIMSSAKAQKNTYVDEFNCAVKYGIVLIQGKMKIHQNYLKFISSFNAKTFFGQTNIRIPKWDIESIQKKYILLSLVITVNTNRGPVSFTSFLSDPYDKLTQIYHNKQPTRKIITKQNINIVEKHQQNTPFEDKITQKTANQTFPQPHYNKTPTHNSGIDIIQLEQKFQSEIPELIDKKIINFQSLSTYLSESKKQLSISVQYHLFGNKQKRYFFQIKIMDKSSKIEYKFVHQKSMQDKKIKKMLQDMVTKIINSKLSSNSPKKLITIKKISNNDEQNQNKLSHMDQKSLLATNFKTEEQKQDRIFQDDSCSFIERKQNNQFQFDRDPSFVYIRQHSLAHGGEPSFNYVPDLQIFKNMDSQRKIPHGAIEVQRHNQNSYSRNSNKKSESSLTQKQISEYLNSLDERDIKKNLFISSQNRNKKNDKQFNRTNTSLQIKDNQKTIIQGTGLTFNHIVIILIVIIGLNFVVSIFK